MRTGDYNIVSDHGSDQGILRQFLFFLFLRICLSNISNNFYHGTGEDQLSEKHKIRTGECCLGEHCISSWVSYGLKQGTSCHLFVYLYFINIMYS